LGPHFKGEGSCKKNEIAFPLPPILKGRLEEKKNKFHPFEWVPIHPF